MKIGIGYDIHRLVAGRKLILGGVEIPSEKGLLGHSDADIALHALCDAVLGALGLGDIGEHFPDTDPRYKDISSLKLLGRVAGLARERKYTVHNADITLILEEPRIGPFKNKMKQNIARMLKLKIEDVNVKATTNEGAGAIGRSEAASALAVVTLMPVEGG